MENLTDDTTRTLLKAWILFDDMDKTAAKYSATEMIMIQADMWGELQMLLFQACEARGLFDG